MSWVLTSTSTTTKDLSWSLISGSLVLGRALDCNIVIHDPTVSRRHCRISVDDGAVYLDDLGSRHPATVNGVPTLHTQLNERDIISIGSAGFQLTRGKSPAIKNEKLGFDTTTCSLPQRMTRGEIGRGPGAAKDASLVPTQASPQSHLLGESKLMAQVREAIQDTAATDLNVLVTGETGTGKELAAMMLHHGSQRLRKPLVSMNCAAIPDHLFESELFGHEKGAFTGAEKKRKGRFAMAHGGTLFFDEIGDLSLDNQARLLRTLETGNYYPIGSDTEAHADVRVVAATHRDLGQAIREGKFREDLYHRICAVTIVIPPLRRRMEDIPQLVYHFLDAYVARGNCRCTGISDEGLLCMQAWPWPGNVRELKNAVERAAAFAKQDLITPLDLAFLDAGSYTAGAQPAGTVKPNAIPLAAIEREHIERVLEQYNNNVSAAARALGIHRNTLGNKIAEYGIER